MSMLINTSVETSTPSALRTLEVGGLRRVPHRVSIIAASGTLAVSGTSSAESTRLWEEPYVHEYSLTASSSGWSIPTTATDERNAREGARWGIAELRRISGLTWDQLGQLFGVTRRSVHFWASGKPLNAANEERLFRALDVLRACNRGDPRATRRALVEASGGITALDLLITERFDEARAMLGEGALRPESARAELDVEAKAARKPLPPEDLVGALHEPIHKEIGRSRAGRTVRSKRDGDRRG